MMSNLCIRKYAHKDRMDVLDLMGLNTPTYFAPDEKSDLQEYLDDFLEDYFVVTVHSQVIACGGINYEDSHQIGIISWDIVHPNFQGKGIGKKLLEHRLNLLKSNKSIRKIVVRTSQLTDKFYEKIGFKLVEVKKDFWAKGFDLYRMEILLEKKE